MLFPLCLAVLIRVAAGISGGFTFNGNIELQGVAEVSTNGLFRLTDTTSFTVGHVFYAQPLTFKNSSSGKALSFSTTFVIAIVVDKSSLNGHGMAFVIAPSKELSGASAQNLGLFNRTNDGDPSNRIVAVEFDNFQNQEFNDINDNHVGIDINSLTSVDSAPAAYFVDATGEFKNISLASGERIQVWVDYDATRNQLNVTLSPIYVSKPKLPLLSLDVDISPIVLDQMYVGFSSSTGRLVQSHYVLGWSFQIGGKAQLDLSRLPSLPVQEQSKSNKNKELAIGLSVTGVVLAAIIVSLILLFKKKKDKFAEILEDWEVQYGPHRFSYKDLVVATRGFREKELLGKGGFGEVYGGVLPVSKIQVAVKRISHNSKQGMKEFVAEIATIGRLRHPNLVRLLGYCRGEGELLLVYDYMPNASLDKLIYNKTPVTVNWNQRFKIIKDVSSGLAYLHEELVEVIVHRDIKASNVLLDGELNGKLGDFGLARISKRAQDPQTTHVAGTFGYIAPELAKNGKATTSTDVYAYGAFCLEVACGRRPVESRVSPEEANLVDWVYRSWREGKILNTVDPKLNKDFNVKEVELVLKLGLLCSHPVAEVRPRMSQVLLYLKGHASLPENFDFQIPGPDQIGKSYSPAILNYTTPPFTVTESFKSAGR
ncbi:L-type lectin-domain containing receptor kinase V.9 [Ricinus communis]|nr:L-type lectin-domain containing receptor kinase V.9 [Ricinus communis]XP_048236030.1 L-type lectin-domain containing receptor kinase V.9 [Ricinus communis]XP_048236031.1 L-type lectin-domain containing receptor kinase V.9 [Ricinus communis]|eukprot:XP_002534540.2 L-type lectin-domain containing receptor kinase V.9 [Ricinus communis]